MPSPDGVEATRELFARMSDQLADRDWAYHPADRAYRLMLAEREAEIVDAVHRHTERSLSEIKILDAGCGAGTTLSMLAAFGANQENLHGVELVQSRVEEARRRLPKAHIELGSAHSLDCADGRFDVVMAVIFLCVIHPASLRAQIAAELVRVLAPGGLLLCFDVTPVSVCVRATNRGLRLLGRVTKRQSPVLAPPPIHHPPNFEPTDADLRALFTGCRELECRSLGVYRPLAERFAPRATRFRLLQAVPLFHANLLWVGRRDP